MGENGLDLASTMGKPYGACDSFRYSNFYPVVYLGDLNLSSSGGDLNGFI